MSTSSRRGGSCRPFEDDEQAQVLVTNEAMLGAGRNKHGMALSQLDGIPFDLERSLTLEDDVDLVVFMGLLSVRLRGDEDVDPKLELLRTVDDLVAACSGQQALLDPCDVEWSRGGERLQRAGVHRTQLLTNALTRRAWIGRTRLGARSPQVPAHELDRAGNRQRDRERKQQALPGRVFERVAAEVPEQRGVDRPEGRGGRIEDDEPRPRVAERAATHRHRRAATRYEPGDHDQLATALADLALRPRNSLPGLLAAEEPVLDPGSEAGADQVGGVVAEERSGGGQPDDEHHVQVAGGGDDARGDHGGLARDYGDDRVEVRKQEHDQVRPARGVRYLVGELAEDGPPP